ncbi:MAG: hypothetical protein ACPGDB_03520, partial [Fusobacterium sp.]
TVEIVHHLVKNIGFTQRTLNVVDGAVSQISKEVKKNNKLSKNEERIVNEILSCYERLNLPKYDKITDSSNLIMKACDKLGEVKVEEALKKMSESIFVKKNLSINSIFKIENLEKGLNGYFKDFNKKENEDEDYGSDPYDIW